MSNGDYEGNKTEVQKEALRKLKTRMPVENAKELTITAELDPKILAKNEWFNQQAERLSAELRDQGVEVDSSEINPSNFKSKVEELRGLKRVHDQARRDADPTHKPSSGSLTLQGQNEGNSEGDEWNSVEEMIDDIQRVKRTGTPAQKKQAQKVLDVMFLKSLRGMEEKARLEGKFVKSVESKDEEGVIAKLNREFRERRKKKKDVNYNE